MICNKLTTSAKILAKAHSTDLGYDLYSDEDVILYKDQVYVISTGLTVYFPKGWDALVKDRSSMAAKGIFTHGGVIDESYTGEIKVIMTFLPAPGNISYEIKKGDKIAQLVPVPTTNFEILDGTSCSEESKKKYIHSTDGRGNNGFGSSGN